MTTDQSVGSKYNINGFPTIKFFGENKKSPLDYDSGRTAKDLVAYGLKQAESLAYKRLGTKPEARQEQRQESRQENSEGNVDDKDVVVLTDNNFDESVFNSNDLWFVEFYAPWCGHCKKLAPEWAQAASSLKNQVKLGKVDATVEKRLASKYGINSYPTIKIFYPGKTDPEDFNGPRDASSITRIALNKLDESGKPITIPQIVSATVLNNNCEKEVCVLAFLPHIYDSSATERNRYIETFAQSAKKNRGKPVKFLWVQAGDYFDLEKVFGLGSGYPAVVGLSVLKNRVAVMKSAFKVEEIETFVRKLLVGNVPLVEYKELPKVKDVLPWDGLDHQPDAPVEDL